MSRLDAFVDLTILPSSIFMLARSRVYSLSTLPGGLSYLSTSGHAASPEHRGAVVVVDSHGVFRLAQGAGLSLAPPVGVAGVGAETLAKVPSLRSVGLRGGFVDVFPFSGSNSRAVMAVWSVSPPVVSRCHFHVTSCHAAVGVLQGRGQLDRHPGCNRR